jgi:hypothetical protein
MRLRVPPTYATTRYSLPDSGSALYALAGEKTPLVWEAKVGDGSVTFAGIAPGFASATAQTSRWLRAIAKRAYEKTGARYEEQTSFVSRRGPYAAVRTLGSEFTLEGTWVNLFSPTLAVVEDPVIPARSNGLYMAAGSDKKSVGLLAASGRLRAKSETSAATGFIVQAPAKTEGVARLFAGDRRALGAKAYTMMGESVPVSLYPDGNTLLVRYANDPAGIVVRVSWQ